MELHENSKEGLPPVKTKVTLGKEDLSIKVNLTHICIIKVLFRSVLAFIVFKLFHLSIVLILLVSRSATEEEESLSGR